MYSAEGLCYWRRQQQQQERHFRSSRLAVGSGICFFVFKPQGVTLTGFKRQQGSSNGQVFCVHLQHGSWGTGLSRLLLIGQEAK